MMKYHTFECGCSLPIQDENYISPDGLPGLGIDIETVSLDCPKVWELFSKGFNAGIFQLESPLGKQWIKRMQVDSVSDVIALGSLLRPGCLAALDENGVSMTQKYALRKLGKEQATPIHPAIADILEETYHICCFQEQAMQITAKVAGFTKVEQDKYRKAAGKKLQDVMAEVEDMFLEKSQKIGLVTEAEAKYIFDILKASGRYSFNKSHAASYGVRGYWTAWIKAHCPTVFFLSWLQHAKYNNKEDSSIQDLLTEAKLLDVNVALPKLSDLEEDFYFKNNSIRFGITNIKKLGASHLQKIKSLSENMLPVAWNNYYLVMCKILFNMGATSDNLIDSGSIDYLGVSRTQARFDLARLHDVFKTATEITWFKENYDKYNSILELFDSTELVNAYKSKARLDDAQAAIKSWKHPSSSLSDNPLILIDKEIGTLKVPVTKNIGRIVDGQVSCKELFDNVAEKGIVVVTPSDFKRFPRKNGPNAGLDMLKMKAGDDTGELEFLMFESSKPEKRAEFSEYYNKLFLNIPVILECHRWNDVFVINKITSIS